MYHPFMQLWRFIALNIYVGFALGGLLASAIIVQIWKGGYIPAQLLQENLACITFAQPHLPVPQLAELAKDRPMISSTIYAVYYEEDLVPRMMRFLDQPCSTLITEKELGLQLKVKEPPKPVSDVVCSLQQQFY